MAETTTFEITWPYHFSFAEPRPVPGGDTLHALTLREPDTADALEFGLIDGTIGGDSWVGLIAKLSSEPPSKIKALPYVETMRLINRLSGFFSKAVK